MKKQKSGSTFSEEASELAGLPPDADETINCSDYCKAHDKNGNCFFIRLGRRKNKEGDCAEIWFGFYTQDGKAYMNSKQLYRLNESPVKAECIEPLRKWEFSFSGKVIPVKPEKNNVAEPCGTGGTETQSKICQRYFGGT